MSIKCQGCAAETATEYLCGPCRGRLEWLLAEVDAVIEELDTTLTRQARTGARNGGRGTETPLAYHAGASDKGRDLRDTLKSWAGNIAEELVNQHVTAKPPVPATAQSLASFLLRHLDWITRWEQAGDILTEVERDVKACQRVVDTAPELITLGPCGGEVEGVVCDNPLRAVKGRDTITCNVCATTWDVTERRDWLLSQAHDVHVTATEASKALPVTVKQVAMWASRGHLDPAGTRYGAGERAQPTYVLAHVHRLHRMSQTGARLSNIDKENAA